jgi:hypothetical protein
MSSEAHLTKLLNSCSGRVYPSAVDYFYLLMRERERESEQSTGTREGLEWFSRGAESSRSGGALLPLTDRPTSAPATLPVRA